MTTCPSLIGRLFGHKMEGCYNHFEGLPDGFSINGFTGTTEAMRSLLIEAQETKTTYIHHVCTRCGLVVKQEDKNEQL